MTIPVIDQAIRLLAHSHDATGAEVEVDQLKTRPPSEPQEPGTLQLAQGHRPGEFGHYRIIRLLGKGGMGEVYEAEDQESGRRVALKILNQHLDSPTDTQRFLREGRLAAQVNHSNCVYVYGSEEIDGTPVISMEFVPGGTLKDQVKREGPMSIARAVDAILAVIGVCRQPRQRDCYTAISNQPIALWTVMGRSRLEILVCPSRLCRVRRLS
jgi:hypothetical protein